MRTGPQNGLGALTRLSFWAWLPPSPWSRWDDGDPVGWDLSWRLWRYWLLPYRTAEYLGYDKATLEMQLGPWRWHRPDAFARLPRSARERAS